MAPIRDGLAAAGRPLDELEIVGGLRPRFTDATSPADLDEAFEGVGPQLEAGYTSFCFNPSQYVDRVEEVPDLCRRAVERMAQVAG